MAQVRVFLNAKSGNADVTPASVTAMFAAAGAQCVVTEVQKGVDIAALAQTEPQQVAFVAAGGDGTVNAVAAAVAGTGRVMGVLPVGTLNHFARDLGLPLDLKEAVAVAAGERTRAIDAAEVNGVVFVNNSSLGVYPQMVKHRERMKRGGVNKWLSLAWASWRVFWRFRRLEGELEVAGQVQRCVTPFVFVGNNAYCLDAAGLGTRKCVDEGTLSVFVAVETSRAGLLRMLLATVLGRAAGTAGLEEFKVHKAVIRLRKKRTARVSLDGEVRRMAGPFVYQTRPGALRVLSGSGDE